MSKRKFSEIEGSESLSDIILGKGPNKNSLDSDEEDEDDEAADKYALKDDDIEGKMTLLIL